jgi:hypothetical protein
MEYHALEKKLDALSSEDKKVINFIVYRPTQSGLWQSNLRMELIGLSAKERLLIDRAKEIILKADSSSETNG